MNAIKVLTAVGMAGAVALPLWSAAAENAGPLGGKAVSGVCLLGQEAVFANARVGKNVTEQLQKLTIEAQAEINAEQKPINEELERLGLRGATLQESQLTEPQRAALRKLQALQQEAAVRGQQIEAARIQAMQRLSEAARPIIAQVYAKHECGLLLNRSAVLGGNMRNDLTADVVTGLDAKITTLPITLEEKTVK
ncbi:MAG: OmpH family outer membrane protein [Zoogloeaceae bacterium]|jgi:Skp family chaperone for outer membrane proteins|nr:OmpH family outer membrane protein [Zoogloeaceae bacterium]